MKIQFVDLKKQNKIHRKEFMRAIEDIVDSAEFIGGSKLEKFEQEFAKFCGKEYAIGLNSGTDALKIALLAYGVGPGDEVITAANSYFSTAMVIADIGAVPVLVDVREDTQTIDTNFVKRVITKKTKAIIPIHLFGQACDIDPILALVKKHKLIVIEDACQAHGALYKGKTVPVGETGAFSFYPGKNLGCFGDGGAIVTDSRSIYEKCLYLRNDGSVEKYSHKMIGMKSRLDSLQAAVLSAKLPYLNEWNKKRREAAELYGKHLEGIPGISLPKSTDYSDDVYHLYVISCDKRDDLKKYLDVNGVQTVIHYPIPIHLQKGFKSYGYKKGDFPVTEKKARIILSLPMFPEITEEEIKYIASKISSFARKNLVK